MKIIVFGASGRTGHHLVSQALVQGHHVTAFVRNPARLRVTGDHLRIVEGNVLQYDLVSNAIVGQDAVLSTLGAASPFRYDAIGVEGMGNVVKAMQQAGVHRLVR